MNEYSVVSLVHEILGPRLFRTCYISSLTKIPPKTNLSYNFLIILLSHDEISAFLLSGIVRNSSLLTGLLISISRKSLLLRLRSFLGLCKDKTQREHVCFCRIDLQI